MTEFLHEYQHLMTDPAHTAVEFTFVLIDVLIISWVRDRIIKHIHRDVKGGADYRDGHNRRHKS